MFQRILKRHLDKGEKLYFIIDRHPIVLFKKILFWLCFGVALPIALIYYYNLILIAAAFAVLIALYLIYHLADDLLDAWLVTSRSVIDVEWNGFLHQRSTRIPYREIRDVSWEKKGALHASFNIGNCIIRTTTGGEAILNDVSNPRQAELKILAKKEEVMRAERMRDADHIQELLSDIVADHMSNQGFRF